MSKNNLSKILLLIVLFLYLSPVFSQQIPDKKVIPKLEYYGYGGGILVHRDAMDGLGGNPYFGNELRLGFQTTGTEYWHQPYNYPTFGLGFYSATFNNTVLGKPKAVFAFLEFPFARKAKSYFSTSWGIGAAFNINEYDSITNPENVAIGSDLNVFIDFSFMYKHMLTKRFGIGGGLKLQHLSNGAYMQPNLGLNMVSGTVSLTYYPAQTISKYIEKEKPEFDKNYEVTTMLACGLKSVGNDKNDEKYFNSTVSVSVNKRVSIKRTLGVGFDYFYQSYLIEYYEDKNSVTDKDLMSYAGFLSSGMLVNRFRVVVQLGFYIYRPVDFGLFFYERVALRYYPIDKMFLNFAVKAHGAKAEFIEWGLGFSF